MTNASHPWTRLRFTPLADLLRGRVTGRLDWERQLAAANLPAPVADCIRRVVRRTRLWRIEKTAVADELIAHFADGLASGATADDLVRDFGDEAAAAKLIRRGKKRNRSLVWHAAKYLSRAFLVLLAINGVLAVRFFAGRPTVRVDFLAQINAPIKRIPQADRAWPIYREAMLGLQIVKGGNESIDRAIDTDNVLRLLSDATPADAEWPELLAWLEAHKPGLDAARRAAAKPALGFVLGPKGDTYDKEIGFPEAPSGPILGSGKRTALDDSLITVLLPELNALRKIAERLSADLFVASEQGDAARVISDLDALVGIARQLREAEPFVVTRLVSIGLDQIMLHDLRQTLATRPELLADADLVRLAHRLHANLAGETASAFIDLSAERMCSQDLVQRMYTDNGAGDGRLAPEAVRAFPIMGSFLGESNEQKGPAPSVLRDALTVATGSFFASINSRRDVLDEFARLYGLIDADLARPLCAIDPDHSGARAVEMRLAEMNASPALRGKFLLVTTLMPTFINAQRTAERLIASRDGALVAIALELHRRRHGAYPATLDDLAPRILPSVPKDRITGDALRYRLIDGKPVVYSVGEDRDDDAGRPAKDKTGKPEPELAARWPKASEQSRPLIDGDWILFDGRSATTP